MARTKADYDGLLVQEWLTFAQALAYSNYDAENFNKDIKPFIGKYKRNKSDVQYFLPEIRKRLKDLQVCEGCKYE